MDSHADDTQLCVAISVMTLLCPNWRAALPNYTSGFVKNSLALNPEKTDIISLRTTSAYQISSINPISQCRWHFQTISESLALVSINPYHSIHTCPTCRNPASVRYGLSVISAQLSQKMLPAHSYVVVLITPTPFFLMLQLPTSSNCKDYRTIWLEL